MIASQTLTVAGIDGYALPATLWEPEDPRSAIVVSPATATPRGFYRSFCEYLAVLGAAVVTYDYRGTFEAPEVLRRSPARMRDWGTLDFAGVVEWARARYPGLPIDAVGHSVGGHVLLMTPSAAELRSAVTVASQSGYWRLYRGVERYRVYAFVKAIMPLLTRTWGYFPGERVVFGTNLAPGVLYEWSRWCTSPRYFFADPSMREVLEHDRAFGGDVLMIGITDDPWATPRAISALVPGFTSARVSRREIHPGDYGLAAVGHMGFFRSNSRVLWSIAARALHLDATLEKETIS